jgi:hypothetical protein
MDQDGTRALRSGKKLKGCAKYEKIVPLLLAVSDSRFHTWLFTIDRYLGFFDVLLTSKQFRHAPYVALVKSK